MKKSEKRIFLTFLFSVLTLLGYSQNIIEGVITDSKTGEAMPFVNIAVSGHTIGTISDLNGEFKLSVPDSFLDKDLSISSVGYAPYTCKISSVQGLRLEVKLEPRDLKISQVVVTDKSQAGRKVLKDFLERLSSNYINCDFAYSGDYTGIVKKNGTEKKSVYKFNAYDSQGYVSKEKSRAFESLNYKFSSVSRNFKVDDFETGVNFFDLTSSFDIVRYSFNVLNPSCLNSFDFKIKSETSEVYVIEFNCEKPELINTGVLKPQKYSGEITVNKSDNAILSADYVLEVKDFSSLALSLALGGQRNSAVIKSSVSYAKTAGKYSLKSISSVIDITDSVKGNYSIIDNLSVVSVNYKVPGKISGKVFYSR